VTFDKVLLLQPMLLLLLINLSVMQVRRFVCHYLRHQVFCLAAYAPKALHQTTQDFPQHCCRFVDSAALHSVYRWQIFSVVLDGFPFFCSPGWT
jgi:hypothetical protein